MPRANKAIGMLATALLMSAPASAALADTLQELPVEGLSFSRPAGVTIDLEAVDVALDAIVLKYQLANTGNAPAIVDVTLHLPTLDLSDPDESFAFPTDDPVNFLGATVSVDAAPTVLAFRQAALIEAQDVTRTLREAHLPLLMRDGLQARLAALPPDQLAGLITRGLVRQNGAKDGGTALLFPAWSVRTTAVLHQRVDPGQPVVIEARLLPSVGASQDSVLRKALRQETGLHDDVDRLRKRYCVDDLFVGGVDRIAGGGAENGAGLGERRIDLILAPAAPPDVPVGRFRVTIDKGKPDNLISTCLAGLTKTGPTAFALETAAVPPPRALHILIVGKF